MHTTTRRFDIDNGVWQVMSSQPVTYTIVEKANFFTNTQYETAIFGPKAMSGSVKRLVVIDHKVAQHFGDVIRNYFLQNGITAIFLVLVAEENTKDIQTVFTVLDKIMELKLQRRSEPVIAVGGGVLLDIVGLAASLYRRGIPYVRVPTTLIGLVDAGIGVKTGVNYSAHKNRIGTYYPPMAVLLDTTFLSTLDERQIRNGMGEIMKMAIIKDKSLFALLEQSADKIVTDKLQHHSHAQAIMRQSIHGMLEELENNLWEKDLERLVDFGHSFGPTIEMKVLPELLHGESVAIDMAISAAISYGRSLLTAEEVDRILTIYSALGLPFYHPVCQPKLLMSALEDTTSHRDGLQRMPLPSGIGSATFVNDVTYEEIVRAVRFLKERHDENA